MKRITVLLAEDHSVVRDGLWTLLEAEDDRSSTRRPRKLIQTQLLFCLTRSPTNSPVFSDDRELIFIIHRVEDVTLFVRAKASEGKAEEVWQMLETRAEHMESEIALRACDRGRVDELQVAH